MSSEENGTTPQATAVFADPSSTSTTENSWSTSATASGTNFTYNTTGIAASTTKKRESGYDLPVFGLDSGQFDQMHIFAISAIAISFVCVITVTIVSFRSNNKKFFKWSRGEKTVIYMALCDGLYNVAHSMDHAHYLAERDHVRPPWLCKLYAFTLVIFITAQILLVNISAINAFILIYWQKQINFGRRDWKLLVFTFGVPLIGGSVAWGLDLLGPNGAFCYFDGVKGYLINIFFTTVPLSSVTFINAIIYAITWNKIRVESARIRKTLGTGASTANASHSAAKAMMLFVAAFVVQWWARAIYGAWQLVGPPPFVLFRLVTTFSNLGGFFNGIVFIILRRRIHNEKKHRVVSDDTGTTTKRGAVSVSATASTHM